MGCIEDKSDHLYGHQRAHIQGDATHAEVEDEAGKGFCRGGDGRIGSRNC